MIEFFKVTKYYNKYKALSSFNWKVNKGEIHGLLGHNGAGKTTTFLIANKLIPFEKGEIFINGKNINCISLNNIKKIGLLTEKLKIYKDLKVKEVINFYCEIFDIKNKKKKIQEIIKLFEMESWKNKFVKELSTGMYKKLAISVVFINNPEIIFLDEPFSGLDVTVIRSIKNILCHYNKNEGKTIIIASHNLHEIEEVCDSITIIKNGKNIVSDKLNNIFKKYNFKKSYTLSYILNNIESIVNVKGENELIDKINEIKKNDGIILSINENKIKLSDIYNLIYN